MSADEYDLFTAQANRNFFYLTGLRRDNMVLVLDKCVEPAKTMLFIEEADPTMERWYGRKVTMEEAEEISGIDEIEYIYELESTLDRIMTREDVYTAYFDTYRHQKVDLPDYNVVKANEFKTDYPGVAVKNLFPLVAEERMQKDEDETMEDGTLVLLDLGARIDGYNSDITRTYPVNGRFTERQKQVYDIVLAANRKIVEVAKPGMTTKELNEVCKDVLADGLMKLGLIKNSVEISKYYMHGVSHHLGIDVHDVTVDSNSRLRPGAIISDEPGLYIDEWEIGIRIEDDVLITEDGAVCLSEDIIRTTEDIEAYMAEHKKN